MDLRKIGKFISERRKIKKLTQEALAEKLNISDRAVVAWNGSTWEIATDWTAEFSAGSSYNATNYCEKINDSYAKDFNNVSVTTGDKLYFRLNGNEVF